ncbi:hypothetical protein [Nostoc sp.]|uniref:hypothetical protein n=1 Tax=Nostoc sp. TaxID=1180 RepID=UPI002FFA78F6
MAQQSPCLPQRGKSWLVVVGNSNTEDTGVRQKSGNASYKSPHRLDCIQSKILKLIVKFIGVA